jgi:hypothetical protein
VDVPSSGFYAETFCVMILARADPNHREPAPREVPALMLRSCVDSFPDVRSAEAGRASGAVPLLSVVPKRHWLVRRVRTGGGAFWFVAARVRSRPKAVRGARTRDCRSSLGKPSARIPKPKLVDAGAWEPAQNVDSVTLPGRSDRSRTTVAEVPVRDGALPDRVLGHPETDRDRFRRA